MSFPAIAMFPASQWDGSSATRTAAADNEPILEVFAAPDPNDYSQITAEVRSIEFQCGAGGVSAAAATGGFMYMPVLDAAPTGTPANTPSGFAPFMFDSDHGKLWVYYGGAWHYAALT